MEEIIKTIAYMLLKENAEKWKIESTKDTMLYTLAYNDGVHAMADELIDRINEVTEALENSTEEIKGIIEELKRGIMQNIEEG